MLSGGATNTNLIFFDLKPPSTSGGEHATPLHQQCSYKCFYVSEQVMKETVIKTVQTPVLGEMDEATIQKNREKMFSKKTGKKPAKT